MTAFRSLLSLFRVRVAAPSPSPSAPRTGSFAVAALVVFAVGALLRLVWVQDIEYKADERVMYETVLAVRAGAPWPALGFPSSQNAPAHGMMIWVFLVLDYVYAAQSPPELARVCQCMNLIALAGLLAFIRVSVPAESRGAWLWGAALLAVNPIAIMFQRKIWPISITPPFLLLVLVGFWYRDRRWGAVLWGGTVQFVGMIHAAGLFLAVGLAGCALLFDRKGVRWLWWALGSAAVAWALLPWLQAVAAYPPSENEQFRWDNPLTFNYWIRLATEPFGISVQYNLGKDFGDFMRYPLIGGRATYLMAAANIGLVLIALAVLIGGTARLWAHRRAPIAHVYGTDTRSALAVGAVCVGYGLVITATFVPMARHYMILTFPMMFVWVAFSALTDRRPLVAGWTRGQALLLASCLLQFAVSACLLAYVHEADRPIRGDYGTPYAAQVAYGLRER